MRGLAIIRLLAMGLAIYGLLRKLCINILSIIAMSALRYSSTADIFTATRTTALDHFGCCTLQVWCLSS